MHLARATGSMGKSLLFFCICDFEAIFPKSMSHFGYLVLVAEEKLTFSMKHYDYSLFQKFLYKTHFATYWMGLHVQLNELFAAHSPMNL